MARSLEFIIISKTSCENREAWIPSRAFCQNKMADQSGQGESSNLVRKTRKKKNESSADILAGLAKRLDENSSKKSKKKATVIQFRRDPVTGQRVCKTKYRPNRKYRASKYFDFAILSMWTDLTILA